MESFFNKGHTSHEYFPIVIFITCDGNEVVCEFTVELNGLNVFRQRKDQHIKGHTYVHKCSVMQYIMNLITINWVKVSWTAVNIEKLKLKYACSTHSLFSNSTQQLVNKTESMRRHCGKRWICYLANYTGDPKQNNLNNRKAELINTAVECSVTCIL